MNDIKNNSFYTECLGEIIKVIVASAFGICGSRQTGMTYCTGITA